MENEDKKKDLEYEQQAQRLFNRRGLDQMIQIVRPNNWLILYVLIGVIATILLWSILGSIPTKVDGFAVVMNPRGVFAVEAQAGGTITEIHAQEGQWIEKNTHVATLYDPQRRSLIRNIQSIQFKLEQLKEEIDLLQARLRSNKKLLEEGLIPQTTVEEVEIRLLNTQTLYEEAEGSLASLFSDLAKTTSSYHSLYLQKLRGLNFEDENLDPESIETELSKVYAPESGKVLEVLVKQGDIINADTPLVWMEHPYGEEKSIIFYSCVPGQTQGQIKEGMDVQVEPNITNPQEFGSIIGKVRTVSPFVVSEEELLNDLKNQQLVDYLTSGGSAVIRVIVDPEIDSETTSGFKWTSGEGPPYEIPTGTLCTVKIIVKEQAPISFLIPIWKFKP